MFASVGRLGGQGRHESRTQLLRLEGLLRSIFSVNEGAWYDFAIPYLYDTSTGVAAVDAAGDPIGLLIDRSKGAGLGAELVANGGFDTDTGWTKGPGWSIGSGVASITNSAGANVVYQNVATTGKTYLITFTVSSVSAGGFQAYCGAVRGPTQSSAGTYTARLTCGATDTFIGVGAAFDETTGTIDNISVKLIDGNHSIQATAAARPTYRIDAAGRQYAAFLGTDDSLTSATGGGGDAGFFLCAAIRPTGGAGTVRRIFSDGAANSGYIVTINASNVFTLNAGNGTAYTPVTGAAGTVGTDYVVMVWDDGTNLNAQVNNGVIASVARPVVVAGTAGYTIGKDNVSASGFLTADVYHMAYAKNTGLTAAQRRSVQQYAASKIGITL